MLTWEEKLKRAREFVRDALKHTGSKNTEEEIERAAVKVARSMPSRPGPVKRKPRRKNP